MKKVLVLGITIALLALALPASAGASVLRVSPGPGTPIQDAINTAGNGDTIFVSPGTYVENVIVNKAVFLKGAGADSTVVQGKNHKTAFLVTAESASISGFTIKDADDVWQSGISISNANNVTISKNTIERNAYGIFVSRSNGTSIVNNVIRYSDAPRAGNWWMWPRVDNGTGIIVWDDGGGADLGTKIKANEVYYNFKFGIYVGGASTMGADGTQINGNKLYHNGWYTADYNWLGMGFQNAQGTLTVAGNNVLPTNSGLDYWVDNAPGLALGGTPSYGGRPVPPAP